MRPIFIACMCAASLGWLAPSVEAKPRAPALTPQAIEDAAPTSKPARGLDAATIKAGILLDRAGFSPGVIDGRGGENFKKALAAYQAANGLERSGWLDQATWNRLNDSAGEPVLTDYEITPAETNGPFVRKLPRRLEDMAKLPRLAYARPREELAERFHMSEELLGQLNPGADFAKDGTLIRVANVTQMGARTAETSGSPAAQAERSKRSAAKVEVDEHERAVRVLDRDGALLAYFPASIGSAEKPAPSGSFKVMRVQHNPIYHYDPKFAFKGVKARHAFTVKAGPNNPVGLVWIDLSAPSYGIHGTPHPEAISKTQSHGCVRLTNWDALKLAAMVRRGTPVDTRRMSRRSGHRFADKDMRQGMNRECIPVHWNRDAL